MRETKYATFVLLGYIISVFSAPTGQPSEQPSSQPTTRPSSQPSAQPTNQPTIQPSSQPTSKPSYNYCKHCLSGQFYNTNLAAGGTTGVVGCTSCIPGYTCHGGCSDPQPCGLGTFAAGYSATVCDNCAAGSYNLATAQVSCTACPAGFLCATATAGDRY